ncbi:MAG: acetyl-CoA carboxylase carboxyl transferase subunit alpha, partial [Thiothrix sp.]|nr:acetyl-CoA carboxylase carboxyl transferase subunit alpha [Thiothrix sp.]
VISPEGCASILWKSVDKAADAADAMGITADRLKTLGLVDEVIPEPLGGAHRNFDETARHIGDMLETSLRELRLLDIDTLIGQRQDKFLGFGRFESA